MTDTKTITLKNYYPHDFVVEGDDGTAQTIPLRLTSPIVGLIPTSPFAPDGQTIDPSVSVPMPIAARFAAIAAPVPELDPHGFRSSA